jgi:hypothetical protein
VPPRPSSTGTSRPRSRAIGDAGPESLEHHVGVRVELEHEVGRAVDGEVDREVALAGVGQRVQARVAAVALGSDLARQVAVRWLELDHVGAEIREDAPAHGPGQDTCKIDDAPASEWRRGRGARVGHAARF